MKIATRTQLVLATALAALALTLACSGPPAPASNTGPASRPASSLDGFWSEAQSKAILESSQVIRVQADLTSLTAGERACVKTLIEVGRIFERIYEQSRHGGARAALADLQALDRELGSPARTQNLLRLYKYFQGPIATTLDNQREPFLPVRPEDPGKNVYPPGVTRAEIEAFLAANPDQRSSILAVRTAVRRIERQNLATDLAALDRHPVLDILHPGLRDRLRALAQSGADKSGFYAVPYAVAHAGDMVRAHALLHRAAGQVKGDDWQFAGYLRNRARDLLSNDYESGDASWVRSQFGRLNGQIGAYEVYDDALFGVKAFYSLNVLVRDEAATRDVARGLAGLQDLEDSLPYQHQKRVSDRVPIGVYNVVADFGQARGFPNGATILPNEPYLTRRHGRTIMIRRNISQHPKLVADRARAWTSAVAPAFAGDLTAEAQTHWALWHEVGHYLGVDRDKNQRDLSVALAENVSIFEEMKADLVSVFVAPRLRERGIHDDAGLKAHYAAGIYRTLLLRNRPRRDQSYGVMILMQLNYFLERGLLAFDRNRGRVTIDYDRYHDVVAAMLRQVLHLQHQGDKGATDQFIARYTTWSDDLHGVLTRRFDKLDTARFSFMMYAALGE